MGLQEKLSLTCWMAKHFFDRGMGSGTTGNLSFAYDGKIYITGGGTCFGTLAPEQFSVVDPQTMDYIGLKPSKELPLHLAVYRNVLTVHAACLTLQIQTLLNVAAERDAILAGGFGLAVLRLTGHQDLVKIGCTRQSLQALVVNIHLNQEIVHSVFE